MEKPKPVLEMGNVQQDPSTQVDAGENSLSGKSRHGPVVELVAGTDPSITHKTDEQSAENAAQNDGTQVEDMDLGHELQVELFGTSPDDGETPDLSETYEASNETFDAASGFPSNASVDVFDRTGSLQADGPIGRTVRDAGNHEYNATTKLNDTTSTLPNLAGTVVNSDVQEDELYSDGETGMLPSMRDTGAAEKAPAPPSASAPLAQQTRSKAKMPARRDRRAELRKGVLKANAFASHDSTKAIRFEEDTANGFDPEGAEQRSGGHEQDNTIPPAQVSNQTTMVEPPEALMSFLCDLRPSHRARPPEQVLDEVAAAARLIACIVILFRMDRVKEAQVISQYTFDLIGKQTWDETLAQYMVAPPLPDDATAVKPLLYAAVEIVKYYSTTDAAYLEGALSMVDWDFSYPDVREDTGG